MENQKEWQPSPGTHALGADLLPSVGYYESAVNAINGRHYALALDYLQAARAVRPDDVRVLTAFGVVYDKLGRFDLSARYYAQAAALDPKSTIIAQDVDYSHHLQVMVQGPAASVSSISTAANIPTIAPVATVADTRQPEAPWLRASDDTSIASGGARHPQLVTAPGAPAFSSVDANIVTAVNIPKIAPEATVAEEMPPQAPWLMTASAAPLNTSAWHPVMVNAPGVPAFPSVNGNIATAVNIPKIAPEATVAEEPPQAPWLMTANAAPLNTSAWRPVMVNAPGVPAFPSVDGNIATAVNIPKMAPEPAAEEMPPQAPWLMTANAAPLNTSAWRPVMVTAPRMPAFRNPAGNIVSAVNVPTMTSRAAEALKNILALTVRAVSSNAGNHVWRPVPVARRPTSAVPPLDARFVATLKIPQLKSKTVVADAIPLQIPKPQTAMGTRTVVLVGHPLVLVNASGHHDTPMSVGRRLSGLGWSVAKSVETAPRVQAKTLIIYQKSKSAVAMALARTLFLTPRLAADKDTVGLRLVIGSDLFGSIFKAHLSPVSGKRIKLADAGHQSGE
jgi:hypothetical protein